MSDNDVPTLTKASEVEEKINEIISKDIWYFGLLLKEYLHVMNDSYCYLRLTYAYCNSDTIVTEAFELVGSAEKGISLDNIFTQIAKNTTIEGLELKFQNVNWIPLSYQKFPYMLQENHTLRYLDFDRAQIANTDVKYLCQGLLVNKNVTRLGL